MKKILLLFMLCFLSVYASTSIKVLKIYDGDTIKAKVESGNKFSIRLVGIDCYETNRINRAYKQAYVDKLTIDEVVYKGNKARKYLKSLYKNSNKNKTSFDFMGIDKYGRALGVVYFDNLNINEELLKNNICLPYKFKKE